MSQLIYTKEQLQYDWGNLTPDVKSVLIDIATKIELIRKLDDGYGKVVVSLQRKEIRSISMVQDKLVTTTE